MPLRVGWYIKDRILLIEAKGVITDEEYITLGCSPVILSAMDNSPASRIDYFFDIVDPHAKLPSLRVRGKTLIEKHKKDGWAILIHFRLNPFWHMTATIIAQVSQGRFRFFDSFDEALTFMCRIDTTLPAVPDAITDWFYEVNWTAPDAIGRALSVE